MGKIGAFVGTWIFPAIQRKYADPANPDLELQVPFYVSSALCLFSALLTFFFCPPVGQDAINREDQDFVNYLEQNGFDITQLGEGSVSEIESDAIQESDSVEKINEKLKPVKNWPKLKRSQIGPCIVQFILYFLFVFNIFTSYFRYTHVLLFNVI